MSRTRTLRCVASHLMHELLRRRSPQATGITIAHLDDMDNKMRRLDGMMRARSEAGMTLDADGPVSFPHFMHPLLKGLIALIAIQEANHLTGDDGKNDGQSRYPTRDGAPYWCHHDSQLRGGGECPERGRSSALLPISHMNY